MLRPLRPHIPVLPTERTSILATSCQGKVAVLILEAILLEAAAGVPFGGLFKVLKLQEFFKNLNLQHWPLQLEKDLESLKEDLPRLQDVHQRQEENQCFRI
mmetsp:Transcript_106845/g.185627  ORF Transcript_106845/g.185627 Transcript_106845/m.185627 type:complete len:101 (+) Transcript_106845:53-355(+)